VIANTEAQIVRRKMSNNGMTNKEMLMLVLEGQDKINSRIDELHEKVNTKISRSELLATATFIVLLIGGIIQYSM
jgi:VIT1/CCC1 family predicted Fe2+/Mn2+ transporter